LSRIICPRIIPSPQTKAKRGWDHAQVDLGGFDASLRQRRDKPGCPIATCWLRRVCIDCRGLEDLGRLKAGMTRRDAEQYFALDGGMNFRGQMRYVYGKCELIQVEITFEEDPDVRNDFSQKDKITNLSKLFLAFPSKD
jgi:hypothetical protein